MMEDNNIPEWQPMKGYNKGDKVLFEGKVVEIGKSYTAYDVYTHMMLWGHHLVPIVSVSINDKNIQGVKPFNYKTK